MPYTRTGPGPGDLRPAVHDARRGHRRAAHRVRQRVEPARRARVAATARGGGAHGARRRERPRVVRQHLTEVLVLAIGGGGLGILLSVVGMRWFTQALSINPPPFWITFESGLPRDALRARPDRAGQPVRRRAAGAARRARRRRHGAQGRQSRVHQRHGSAGSAAAWSWSSSPCRAGC